MRRLLYAIALLIVGCQPLPAQTFPEYWKLPFGYIGSFGSVNFPQGRFWFLQDTVYVHSYGGFYDSTATVVVTQDSISAITNVQHTLFNVGHSVGITVVGDSAIILKTGEYKIDYSFTMSGLNGKDFDVGMICDGAWIGAPQGETTTGTTNFANVSGFAQDHLDSACVIKPAVMGKTDGTDPIFRSGGVSIELKH